MKEHNIPASVVDDLTEDEQNYLYFKVHDLDGNNKLDGLEIYYSVTHHSRIEKQLEKVNDMENENENAQVNDNASLLAHKMPKIDKQNLDVNDETIEIDFNHIVGE